MIRGKGEKRKSQRKEETTEVAIMELGVALKNNL